MDPLDLAIFGLRLVLVALLYLFLLTVVRVAMRGLQLQPASRAAAAAQQAPAATARPSTLRLVVVEAGGAPLRSGQTLEIAESAVLGRAERADIVLADAAISSEHVRLQRVGQAWVVTDLGSTNGTRLNDTPLPSRGETTLAPGDVLSLGNVRLRVAAR
jgi:hypothetical protein